MDFINHPLFAYFSSWVMLMGGIWVLFEQAEKTLALDTKTKIAIWINNLDPAGTVASWPDTFASLFDHLFTNRHLSWKCFFRSCLASILTVTLLFFVWMIIYTKTPQGEPLGLSELLPVLLLFVAVLNLLPDYLSLLETRYMLKFVKGRKLLHLAMILFLDLLATYIIMVLALILMIWGVDTFGSSEDYNYNYLKSLIAVARCMLYPRWVPDFPIWISFYSTLFTSVWLWLYILIGAVVKLTKALNIGLDFMKRVIDTENRPLSSLGFIANIIFTIIFLIASIVELTS